MNSAHPHQRLWTSALVLLGLALGLSIAVGRHAWNAQHRLERQYHYTRQLAALQQQGAHVRAARAAFEELPTKTPRPFKIFLDDAPADTRLRAVEPSQRPASAWTLRAVAIDFTQPHTAINATLAWAAHVEQRSRAAMPPWRLAQATINAAPGTPGQGEITLMFEALETTHEQ